MATPTYEALATTTLGSQTATVTFDNIDQSYGDLVLVFSGKLTSARGINVVLNETGTHFRVIALASGASIICASQTNATYMEGTTTQSIGIMHIMDYSSTDKKKPILSLSGHDNFTSMVAGRNDTTSAVTSILVDGDGADFQSGTTLSLFGVAK